MHHNVKISFRLNELYRLISEVRGNSVKKQTKLISYNNFRIPINTKMNSVKPIKNGILIMPKTME